MQKLRTRIRARKAGSRGHPEGARGSISRQFINDVLVSNLRRRGEKSVRRTAKRLEQTRLICRRMTAISSGLLTKRANNRLRIASLSVAQSGSVEVLKSTSLSVVFVFRSVVRTVVHLLGATPRGLFSAAVMRSAIATTFI
jgi:hypothetical protein